MYCEWNYNGLGLDYQLLAGPSFILVFTVIGIFMGVLADKYNRVRMLSICTIVFAVAIILQGSVTKYWHLVVLRMIMAAGESGCNPLATGIMSDIFPEKKRALVMAIFNWGIYGGYGIAFPVGRYITKLNISGLVWRKRTINDYVRLRYLSILGLEDMLLRSGRACCYRCCFDWNNIKGTTAANYRRREFQSK